MKVIKLYTICYFGLFLLFTNSAMALPIIHSALGTQKPINLTLIPESGDENLYYYFPEGYHANIDDVENSLLAQDTLREDPLIFINFNIHVDKNLLQEKIDSALKDNPEIRFAMIPISKAEVLLPKNMSPIINKLDCQMYGNQWSSIQCSFKVRKKYISVFKQIINDSSAQILNFYYEFKALQNRDIVLIQQMIPIRVGGHKNNHSFD